MAAVEDTTTLLLTLAAHAAHTIARLGGSAEDVRVVRDLVDKGRPRSRLARARRQPPRAAPGFEPIAALAEARRILGARFLQEPFSPQTLRGTVRERLDGAAA